jgi:hypothetical protein
VVSDLLSGLRESPPILVGDRLMSRMVGVLSDRVSGLAFVPDQ